MLKNYRVPHPMRIKLITVCGLYGLCDLSLQLNLKYYYWWIDPGLFGDVSRHGRVHGHRVGLVYRITIHEMLKPSTGLRI